MEFTFFKIFLKTILMILYFILPNLGIGYFCFWGLKKILNKSIFDMHFMYYIFDHKLDEGKENLIYYDPGLLPKILRMQDQKRSQQDLL